MGNMRAEAGSDRVSMGNMPGNASPASSMASAPFPHVLASPFPIGASNTMPRSTRPQSYPPEYQQLLLAASLAVATPDGRYSLQLQTPSAAQSLKSKTYAYFRALREDGTNPDLAAKSELLSLSVEGSTLHLSHREDSWDAKLLREAMGLATVLGAQSTGNTTEQKSILQALKNLRESQKSIA